MSPLVHALLLSLTVALVASHGHEAYESKNWPLVMWSSNHDGAPQEFEFELLTGGVIQAMKDQADVIDSSLVLLFIKEKLSTQKLVRHAQQLPHLKSKVLSNSQVYTNVIDNT
jgi:hypothetical protein